MKCRFCKADLTQEVIDMGSSPPSNSLLTKEQLQQPEVFYPLKLYVCDNCFLVQIDEYKQSKEIFNDQYPYFSSYSRSWLEHCRQYVDMIVNRLNLNHTSFVIEIGSNDGYLLQYFNEKGILSLGIEPTKNTAKVAQGKGIEVVTEFFDSKLAEQLRNKGKQADLLIGNNVLAHVPDINDFVQGLTILLKPDGIITLEFPHLMHLSTGNQFDTIYHEHFSYLSFHTVDHIFSAHRLVLFDVEELPTHGGSLRIYAAHKDYQPRGISANVHALLNKELSAGMKNSSYYSNFQEKANKVKHDLLLFLLKCSHEGKLVVGYGAAAKGNTLLNYCGIKKDLVRFVVDVSPHKQGKFLPESHIPVVHEKEIEATKPDFVLILPWNIKNEIMTQLDYIRHWDGKFIIPIPHLRIL